MGETCEKNLQQNSKQIVRDQINLFPRIETHFCRKKTNKEHMEGSLNIDKQYDLYKLYCDENDYAPVKEHMYRYIFNDEFNRISN